MRVIGGLAGLLVALHDDDLDDGHLVHAQHAVRIEVALLRPAGLQRDLAVQRGGQAVSGGVRLGQRSVEIAKWKALQDMAA